MYVFALCVLFAGYSCNDDDDEYTSYHVTLQLLYPEGFDAKEGVEVVLDRSGSVYSGKTDQQGKVSIAVDAGIYSASIKDQRTVGNGVTVILNAVKTISVGNDWNNQTIVELQLTAQEKQNLIIKELYIGGCEKDDGSGTYAFDQYVILYNNSSQPIDISKVTLAMVNPWNSHSANKDYDEAGKLTYESEGWIPAGMAFWAFQNTPVLGAYEQIVIAVNNAVDNTTTYSKSINFANAAYYCCYDPGNGFSHSSYYSTPASTIPSDHYLVSYRISAGNAWILSQMSPAFFIFRPEEGTTVASFTSNTGTSTNETINRKKVPASWIIDGVEVFKSDAAADANKKRLTANIDAGYVNHLNKNGYSLYRNVDKEATEALVANEGKLVYTYSLGTDGSSDPGGIDAEASIRNGAHIIYMDTNNSSYDFHQRKEASLRSN